MKTTTDLFERGRQGQRGKYYPAKEFCFDGFCSRKTSCLFADPSHVPVCWAPLLFFLLRNPGSVRTPVPAAPQEVTYNFSSASNFLLPTDQGGPEGKKQVTFLGASPSLGVAGSSPPSRFGSDPGSPVPMGGGRLCPGLPCPSWFPSDAASPAAPFSRPCHPSARTLTHVLPLGSRLLCGPAHPSSGSQDQAGAG